MIKYNDIEVKIDNAKEIVLSMPPEDTMVLRSMFYELSKKDMKINGYIREEIENYLMRHLYIETGQAIDCERFKKRHSSFIDEVEMEIINDFVENRGELDPDGNTIYCVVDYYLEADGHFGGDVKELAAKYKSSEKKKEHKTVEHDDR